MGVISLTSLIENNSNNLFESFELRDTTLIIDGYSLAHCLYFTSQCDFLFGGEYCQYRKIVVGFFTQLKSCNVRPIVIFDGPLDQGCVKSRTWRLRHKSKVTQCSNAAKQLANQLKLKYYVKVLPPFATTVFKNVVIDFTSDIIQSFTEADRLIAYKSNQYKCPVLSNDSDFFIYNLKYGYIPFDTLCLTKRHLQKLCRSEVSTDRTMSCMIYYVQNLLGLFQGLGVELLPLFATLTGNDYVKKSHFENFFQSDPCPDIVIGVVSVSINGFLIVEHISKPEVKKKSKLNATNNHCLMIGVLNFLCNKQLNQAIESVLSFVKLDQRERLRSMINNSLHMYDEKAFSMENFGDLRMNDVKRDASIEKLNLPLWIVDRFKELRVHPTIIQLFTNREVFLPCLIEEPGSESVFDCCREINDAVYNLILNYLTSFAGTDRNLSITEWGTNARNQRKREFNLDDNFRTDFPLLSEIDKIDVFERQLFLCRAIGFELNEIICELEKLPPCVRLFTLGLRYWILDHKEKKVDESTVYSLIVSAFVRMNSAQNFGADEFWSASEFCLKTCCGENNDCCDVVKKHNQISRVMRRYCISFLRFSNESISHTGLKLSKTIRLMFNNSLNVYDELKPSSEKFLRTDLRILHELSRFQAVLYSLNLLNTILMEPFQALRIESLYSGVAVYNFIKISKNCVNFVNNVSKIGISDSKCGFISKLVKFRDFILEVLPENSFKARDDVVRKKKSKSKSSNGMSPENKFNILELDEEI